MTKTQAKTQGVARLTEWHSAYPNSVRWRLTEEGLEVEGSGVERTRGGPTTVRAIWKLYHEEINRAAVKYFVPCALIVATIATESGGDPGAERREPGFESYEATPHRISVGLMQTLISTARDMMSPAPCAEWKRKVIDRDWLARPDYSILAGTAYINHQRYATRLDPPLVACAYNAGGIYRDNHVANRWRMRQYPIGTGEHCDRFVKWFNDAVAMLSVHDVSPVIPYHYYFKAGLGGA
ncbi:MAG: transglycosylase SLT domain-containing protein [Syntrophobacteraceae bacterium]